MKKICKKCWLKFHIETKFRWPMKCMNCKKWNKMSDEEKEKKKKINKEKRRLRNIMYKEKHKDRLREYNSKYIKNRRKNDEEFYLRHLISVNKRRATIVNWDVTYEQLQQKLISQDMKCVYCWCDLSLVQKHLDHIVPLSKWWTHEIWNLHWTCSICNLSKNNKTEEEFMEYRNL